MRVVRLALGSLGWLLLVAGVVAGAWYAVGTAGRQVGAPGQPAEVIALPPPSPWSPSPTAWSPSPTGSPTPTPSPGPSPSPSASPGGGKSYQTVGGTVGVRCQGTSIVYWSVHPLPGHTVEGRQNLDQVLQVTADADGAAPAVLRIACRSSAPVLLPPSGTPSPSPSR